jgi:hypothetical protein
VDEALKNGDHSGLGLIRISSRQQMNLTCSLVAIHMAWLEKECVLAYQPAPSRYSNENSRSVPSGEEETHAS